VLTLSPAVRIYVATGATDLRRSIDGLAALVRQRFDLDPLSTEQISQLRFQEQAPMSCRLTQRI
jgi:hypothetical protein